jgi:hypothetical protein
MGGSEQMTTVCTICHAVKSGQGEPISHGICAPCALLFYGHYIRALMKPKADRFDDCLGCRYEDSDSEGIPDGCMAPIGTPCIAPGKRDPWGV